MLVIFIVQFYDFFNDRFLYPITFVVSQTLCNLPLVAGAKVLTFDDVKDIRNDDQRTFSMAHVHGEVTIIETLDFRPAVHKFGNDSEVFNRINNLWWGRETELGIILLNQFIAEGVERHNTDFISRFRITSEVRRI